MGSAAALGLGVVPRDSVSVTLGVAYGVSVCDADVNCVSVPVAVAVLFAVGEMGDTDAVKLGLLVVEAVTLGETES